MMSENQSHLNQRPVFLCGAPRSGTTLLFRLLDGHPELNASRDEHLLLDHFARLRPEDRARFFARDWPSHPDVVAYHGSGDFQMANPSWETTVGDPIEGFMERFLEAMQGAEPSLRELYMTFWSALGGSDAGSRMVDKRPLSNEVHALEIAEAFPGARFIHILRDPRTRYLSEKMRRLRRSLTGRKVYRSSAESPLSFSHALAVNSAASMALAQRNVRTLGSDRYLVITYEGLMDAPEQTMRSVASFLDLEWTDDLTRQTAGGKDYGGNSTFAEAGSDIQSLHNKRLKRYEKSISTPEKWVVDAICGPIAAEYGYDLEVSARSGPGSVLRFLRPARNESISDWRKRKRRLFPLVRSRSQRRRHAWLLIEEHIQELQAGLRHHN